MAAAVRQVIRGGDATRSRREARAAANRLDDAFRQYLGEQSGNRAKLEDLATLLAGATRLRLAAYSLSTLVRLFDGSSDRERYMHALDSEGRRLRSWYMAFGETIVDARVPPRA